MLYNKNLYYLLCSCTNPVFRKNLVPKIEAKMLSANQIAGFLNQLFLQNKNMKVSFFACWYNFTKFKSLSKNFWLGMVKNGCGQSGLYTLKLNEQMELTDYLDVTTNSWKLKRWLKIFRVTGLYNWPHLKNEQLQ